MDTIIISDTSCLIALSKIDIIGTIGVILLADKKGLVADVPSLILRLVNKGFRLSDKMINKIIEKYGRK